MTNHLRRSVLKNADSYDLLLIDILHFV